MVKQCKEVSCMTDIKCSPVASGRVDIASRQTGINTTLRELPSRPLATHKRSSGHLTFAYLQGDCQSLDVLEDPIQSLEVRP